jgi:hypothetical protein
MRSKIKRENDACGDELREDSKERWSREYSSLSLSRMEVLDDK